MNNQKLIDVEYDINDSYCEDSYVQGTITINTILLNNTNGFIEKNI